ncbi:MAG: helix-turn-helix domain-containing protein [Verrucomicrobia bacterium]|nr:helix-turn-helix domain-containing protein [Verrucomicrobiota bacterium]
MSNKPSNTHQNEREIVTASQLAKRYKVTNPTVYLWAKLGKIPCIKFERTIRFDLQAVINLIEGREMLE